MKASRRERFRESTEFLFPWVVIKRRHLSKRDVAIIKNDVANMMNTIFLVIASVCFMLAFSLNIYMDFSTQGQSIEIFGFSAFIGRIVAMFGTGISTALLLWARLTKRIKTAIVLNRIGTIILYCSISVYMFTGMYADAELGFSTHPEVMSASITIIAILVICQPSHWLDAAILDIGTSVVLVVLSAHCKNTFGMASIEYYGLVAIVFPLLCYLLITILFFAESQRYVLSLHNERLTNTANYDSLTKCKSRYALTNFLKESMPLWEKKGNVNILMVLFDIDNFKQYNDQFSHLGGDYCLKSICEAVRQAFPSPNLDFFRYGGEEFLLFFELKEVTDAPTIMETIRKAIANQNIIAPKGAPEKFVTVSLGGMLLKNIETFNFEEEMLKVDTYLYLAKASGKNISVMNGEIINK